MGSKTKQFADILVKAMQSASAGGFDYLSFRKNLKKQPEGLSTLDRYEAAFQATNGGQSSWKDVLAAARKQADVLQEEGHKFRDVLRKQKREKVNGPAEQAQKMVREIDQKRKQIEQLQKEVTTLSKQMVALRDGAEEAADSIRETASDFQSALTLMLNQVQEDINVIKKLESRG